MGKQRKLRSSIKALHDALTSLRPAVGAPLCMQPAKTHSFRDIFATFDSVDYVLPVAAASPPPYSDSRLLLGHPPEAALPSADHGLIACKVVLEEGDEDEGSISVSTATTATRSSTTATCSSCLSSSSLAAAIHDAAAEAKDVDDTYPSGIACSERFFFSPCSSKSIAAAESSPEISTRPEKPSPLRSVPGGSEGGGDDEDDVFDVLLEREYLIDDAHIDWGAAAAAGVSALCRESVPVAFLSRNPYGDFRGSMEEMVAAHGLRGWPELQELLHCYLRLNDKETHKVIALAFVDLLMHLSSQGRHHRSSGGAVVHGAAAASTPVFFPSSPPHQLPASPRHRSPSPG